MSMITRATNRRAYESIIKTNDEYCDLNDVQFSTQLFSMQIHASGANWDRFSRPQTTSLKRKS